MGYVIQACMVCAILAVVAICVNAERSVNKDVAEEARRARERYEAAVESGDFEPIMIANANNRYVIDEDASFKLFLEEENRRLATGVDYGGYNCASSLNMPHGDDYSQQDFSQPAQPFDSCGGYDAGGGFNSFGF